MDWFDWGPALFMGLIACWHCIRDEFRGPDAPFNRNAE